MDDVELAEELAAWTRAMKRDLADEIEPLPEHLRDLARQASRGRPPSEAILGVKELGERLAAAD